MADLCDYELVLEFTGLTGLDRVPGGIEISNGNALVQYRATWRLNGARLNKINQETAVGAGAGESGTMPDDDPAPVTPAHQRVIDAALAWHRVRYRGSIMDVLAVERDLYRALEEMTRG